jgi:hypothetical protein
MHMPARDCCHVFYCWFRVDGRCCHAGVNDIAACKGKEPSHHSIALPQVPATLHSAPAAPADERRAAPRFPSGRTIIAFPTVSGLEHKRWAIVRDVSASGVALLLAAPTEPGTHLGVELGEGVDGCRRQAMARVVRITDCGDGNWLVGCTFDSRLPDEDLATLLPAC